MWAAVAQGCGGDRQSGGDLDEALRAALSQNQGGPSRFCHATDGAFTACPGGGVEWSDVPAQFFPDSNTFLYANQADLDPTLSTPSSPVDTFMLMYDQCGRREPLGPDEYFLVSLSTVEMHNGAPELELYNEHLFTDGTLIFIKNGVPQTAPDGTTRTAAIEGQRGHVGFGSSPNCPFDHVIAEFEIRLGATGFTSNGGYSPDPQFWSSTPPCNASISGGAATMNVGQRADFTASPAGGTYQWTVDGAIIKDYSETTNAAYSATAMAAADFQQQTIGFYWKPDPSQIDPMNGGPVARTVAVDVTINGTTCHAETTINVERNATDIDKQAEDFYTSNHSSRVRSEHSTWHSNFRFSNTTQGGALFFDFHHEFISRFNSWRAEFGYPAVGSWTAGTALPTGPDVDHAARTGAGTDAPTIPTWFTLAGAAATRPSNGFPCETGESFDTGGFANGIGQQRLLDFVADRNLLGCATESPWHNSVHVAIGGDMLSVALAPQDPIFWRWHNYLDRAINIERQSHTPPTVTYQSPFRLFRFITSLPSVTVRFSELVTGVQAADLTVNGSPATQVTGSGLGPYLFTGFAPPALGSVDIAVATDAIVDVDNLPLVPMSWTQTLVDPAADSDGDGLTNGQEVDVFLTNPLSADTDGDGLPDGYEVQHACLDPLSNESSPLSMVHIAHDPGQGDGEGHLPPMDDPDHDGLTNLQEFQMGTDPCRKTFVAGRNAIRTGFDASVLPGNDDGSTAAVDIGFGIDFFGTTYTQLFVNNNGNVTLDAPQNTFTPFPLTSTQRVIIAPFFGDVDTRVGNTLTYGAGRVDDRPAFGVTWPGVGCFSQNTAVLNFFQVLLINRSDVSADDFDIEFNYDSIQWETGQASGGGPTCLGGTSARAGFSNGSGLPGTFFEIAGSGVPGALLDSNLVTGLIHNALNSGQPGRYVFAVRNGTPSTKSDVDGDGVPDELDNCPETANPNQADANVNGIGDACESPAERHDTAAFLQANLDASTGLETTGLTVADEPQLVDRIARIVQFRVQSGQAASASDLTNQLVQSLVSAGIVRAEDAAHVIAEVLAALPAATTIYFNDFEAPAHVGNEWSSHPLSVTPVGARHFLGQLGWQTTSLSLTALPAHTQLTVDFDLYVIQSWDGSDPKWGPDTWRFFIENKKGQPNTVLLETTFSNTVIPSAGTTNNLQAFGGIGAPAGLYPAFTGAAEVDTLGYTVRRLSGRVENMDAVYHFTFTVPHTDSQVKLIFQGQGLSGIADESWGLDNVRVSVPATP
jgi:hypothetical protein